MEELNYWWFSEKWEREDPDLKKWKDMETRWVPKWINNVSLKPFSLNFVLGARQSGKTTGLKFLIKKIIDGGFDPRAITYINCEGLIDVFNLKRWVEKYFEIRKEKDIIILDEITAIEDWWKVVKFFIDAGKFNRSVVIVSGSLSLKIKRYAEAFPGRRGYGKNVEVLPLSFREFLEVKGFPRGLKGGSVIRKKFLEYLEKGGFPRSVNGDRTFYPELVGSFENSLLRIGKDPKLASKIISQIIKKAPSALSFHSISSELGVSHLTVKDYVERFEDMFMAKIIYWKGNEVNFRKEKKVILRDPAIAKAFAGSFDLELRKEVLYEWVVQEHMFRKYGEVYYFKNSYEIDCMAGNLKVEVKAGKPHRRYPRNVSILSEDDIAEFLINL